MNRHQTAMAKLKEGVVIPATPLILNHNRRFDEKLQRRLIRYYLAAGAGGIATAVHTTQFAIRDDKNGLFQQVLETIADEISEFEKRTSNTIIRICGACGDTPQAIAETRMAQTLGYDAVLLSPGDLNDKSEEELVNRTRAVAEILPVIGFYLQRQVGGRYLSFGYWADLCEVKGLVAIKCASFNRYSTLEVVRACAFSTQAEEIALYTGNDDNIVCDLLTEFRFQRPDGEILKRFVGGLLGQWSIWTKRACELLERVKQGDTEGLLSLGAHITDANGTIFDYSNNFRGCIAGIHEVLRRQGLLRGIWCLDPKEGLSPYQAESLNRIAQLYPELNDDVFVREFLAEEEHDDHHHTRLH